MNVDLGFFIKDLIIVFEWSQIHLVAHAKQPTYITTLLVDNSLYKSIPSPLGSYINLTSFLPNYYLDVLYSYLQRLLASQYVTYYSGSNLYSLRQGLFNLELPRSNVYMHALARYNQKMPSLRIPLNQLTLGQAHR